MKKPEEYLKSYNMPNTLIFHYSSLTDGISLVFPIFRMYQEVI